MFFSTKNKPLNENEVQVAIGTQETCCADCIFSKEQEYKGTSNNKRTTIVCTANEHDTSRDRITGKTTWLVTWPGWQSIYTDEQDFQFKQAVSINDGHCKQFKIRRSLNFKKTIKIPLYICAITIVVVLSLMGELFWSVLQNGK